MKSSDVKLYFYNGFEKPKEIDIDNLIIESNYLGDVTDDFMELYKETLENYSLEDAQENQPLYDYNIWINPTLEQLQEQNKYAYGLPINEYLGDFI